MKTSCQFWDADLGQWSTDGVTSYLSDDRTAVVCETTHLTTYGGIITIPTSGDELLAELQSAMTFSTFTMDEAAALLSSFSFADNPTIMIIIITICCLDLFSIFYLGWWRGHRAKIRRLRQDTLYDEEVTELELRQLRIKARKLANLSAKAGGGANGWGAGGGAGGWERRQAVPACDDALGASGASVVSSAGGQTTVESGNSNGKLLILHRSDTKPPEVIKEGTAAPADAPEPELVPPAASDAAPPSEGAAPSAAPAVAETGQGAIPSAKSDAVEVPDAAPESEATPGCDTVMEPDAQPEDQPEPNVEEADGAGAAAAVLKHMPYKHESRMQKRLMVNEMRAKRKELQRFMRSKREPSKWELAITEFWKNLKDTARSEHTIIYLVKPPDDDTALKPAQMVQLFWTTISVELLVLCFFHQESSDSSSGAPSGGRRGGAVSGAAVEAVVATDPDSEAMALSASTFAISPVTAITQGVIAALITMACVIMVAYVFKLGNSRQRKPKTFKERWNGFLQCGREADDAIPDEIPEGFKVVEKKVLTQIGVIAFYAGFIVCPGFNFLALWLCRKKKRALVAIDDAETSSTKEGLQKAGWFSSNALQARRGDVVQPPAEPAGELADGDEPEDGDLESAVGASAGEDQAAMRGVESCVQRQSRRRRLLDAVTTKLGRHRSDMRERVERKRAEIRERSQATAEQGSRSRIRVSSPRGNALSPRHAPAPEYRRSPSFLSSMSSRLRSSRSKVAPAPTNQPVEHDLSTANASAPADQVERADVEPESPAMVQRRLTRLTSVSSEDRLSVALEPPGPPEPPELPGPPKPSPPPSPSPPPTAPVRKSVRKSTGGKMGRKMGFLMDSNDKAATDLQSAQRGRLARKETQKMKIEEQRKSEAKILTGPPVELTLLKSYGRSPKELKEKGYSGRHMRMVGYGVEELKAAGFDEEEFKDVVPRVSAASASGKAVAPLGQRVSSGSLSCNAVPSDGRVGSGGQSGNTAPSGGRAELRLNLSLANVATSQAQDSQEKPTRTNRRLSVEVRRRLSSIMRRKKTESKSIAATALEAVLAQKEKELRWRSPRDYRARQIAAWTFSFTFLGFVLFLSLIYALKYEENAMKQIMLSWTMAYAWTFAIVEPVQIIMLVAIPNCQNEDTKCGRYVGRCRTVYNELCAP